MSNKITVKLDESEFIRLRLSNVFSSHYELVKVSIDDGFLKDDELYQQLKKQSIKAYKAQQNYLYDKYWKNEKLQSNSDK